MLLEADPTPKDQARHAIALTMSRQVFSHARQRFAHSFIDAEVNCSHSLAQSRQASAQAAHEYAINGLFLAIIDADSMQNA